VRKNGVEAVVRALFTDERVTVRRGRTGDDHSDNPSMIVACYV
jgi:hypothetical protein